MLSLQACKTAAADLHLTWTFFVFVFVFFTDFFLECTYITMLCTFKNYLNIFKLLKKEIQLSKF